MKVLNQVNKIGFLLVICIALLTSCNSEDEVKTYRLAKDSSSENLKISTPLVHSNKISWTTPSEWEERPAHGMRVGSFLVQGEDDLNIDISAIFLDGSAGGDLPNVNRWRGQISLPSWTLEELLQNHEVIETPLGNAKIVDFSSEEKMIQGEYYVRVVVATLPYQNGTWFFKMMGEKNLIEGQKTVFKQFLGTVRPTKQKS